MRPILLAAILLALPLAACAGKPILTLPRGPIPSTAPKVTCGTTSLGCTGSARAQETAQQLISSVTLPAGAVTIAVPDSGPLANPATSEETSSLEDAARAWQAPESMTEVDEFVRANPPTGMHVNGTGNLFGNGLQQQSVIFVPATPPQGMCSAQIEVTISPKGSGSEFRIDGMAVSDCDHGVYSSGHG